MNQEVLKMVQEQVNKELYSAYLYLAMSGWCSENSYSGFEKWMRTQVKEEMAHAAYMINYIQDRGYAIELETIKKPEGKWDSILDIFEASYAHERLVTKSITDIFIKARAVSDIKSESFFQWFISEQIEEEKTVSDIIGRLKIAGSSGDALLMLDKEYGSRTFNMPSNISF